MNHWCALCNKFFRQRGFKPRAFCSQECYHRSRVGKPHPGASQSAERNPNWKGGLRCDKDGYLLRLQPQHPFCDCDGYVREHRLVLEGSLKRFLTADEIVHHLNGDRGDNRLENLALMTKTEHDSLPGHFNSYTKRKKDEVER